MRITPGSLSKIMKNAIDVLDEYWNRVAVHNAARTVLQARQVQLEAVQKAEANTLQIQPPCFRQNFHCFLHCKMASPSV